MEGSVRKVAFFFVIVLWTGAALACPAGPLRVAVVAGEPPFCPPLAPHARGISRAKSTATPASALLHAQRVDTLPTRQRHGHRRLTVCTTNLKASDFRARYGERVADRIRECGAFVEIAGTSRRIAGGAAVADE